MFKVPSTLPQDLLLIQDIVGEYSKLSQSQEKAALEESVASSTDNDSDSDAADSEDEVAAGLLEPEEMTEHDTLVKREPKSPSPLTSHAPVSPAEDSGVESDSSSDSESASDLDNRAAAKYDLDSDEEDEGTVAGTTSKNAQVRSKNEEPDPAVLVPDTLEIGPEETLERVGEIFSVMDNVVVVKGQTSQAERSAPTVLDAESVLVFDDRKVLGYVFETFGPTQQPLYQVKFTATFPLNTDIVQVSRPVYHVPQRSKYVFTRDLVKFKGSDASNLHDEEVGENELEFSDDEAEAEYKRRRKMHSREGSMARSRLSTPTPSQLRDQDMVSEALYSSSPYDEYSAYDTGLSLPSRPAPKPYDDPYADIAATELSGSSSHVRADRPDAADGTDRLTAGARGRGRGQRRGRGRSSRGMNNPRHSGHNDGGHGQFVGRGHAPQPNRDFPQPDIPRPLSPTSLAIARVTGQVSVPPTPPSHHQSSTGPPEFQTPGMYWQNPWYSAHPPMQQSGGQYVQPHINPRFAAMFGVNMNFDGSPSQPSYAAPGQNSTGWSGHGQSMRNMPRMQNAMEDYNVPMSDEQP